jgi:hypothetical protein
MQSKYDLVLETLRHEDEEERRNKIKAALFTLLTALTGLLIILFIKIGQPDPPLPLMGGSLGMLGLDDVGMDPQYEGVAAGKPKEAEPEVQEAQPAETQSTATDDEGEDAAITKAEHTAPIKPDEQPKPAQTQQTATPTPQPKLDNRFKFGPPGNNGDGGTQQNHGTGDQAGNQGNPNGSANGNGNGQGIGNGMGTGPGMGDASLAGRALVSRSHKRFVSDRKGRVVVQITVDKTGNIVDAQYSLKGSKNITNEEFIQSCVDDAKANFKFSPDPSGSPGYAVGRVVYDF